MKFDKIIKIENQAKNKIIYFVFFTEIPIFPWNLGLWLNWIKVVFMLI